MRSPEIYHNEQNHPKPRINGDIAIFPSNYIPLEFQKKRVRFKQPPSTVHGTVVIYVYTGMYIICNIMQICSHIMLMYVLLFQVLLQYLFIILYINHSW